MGATFPLFPAFGPASMCLLALYQECIATSVWAKLVFKCAEAMSTSTSPAPVLRACTCRAASALPRSETRRAKTQEGGLGGKKESSNSSSSPSNSYNGSPRTSHSSTSTQTGGSCSRVTAALPAEDMVANLPRNLALQKRFKNSRSRGCCSSRTSGSLCCSWAAAMQLCQHGKQQQLSQQQQ
jgi:hypothetical protein